METTLSGAAGLKVILGGEIEYDIGWKTIKN